jgi:hypothetical protein
MTIKARKYLDIQTLLKNLGQERIMHYYLGIKPEFGKLFCSPFRKDNRPTCSFGYTRTGSRRLVFNDYGVGKMYSVFDVIMKVHNLTY